MYSHHWRAASFSEAASELERRIVSAGIPAVLNSTPEEEAVALLEVAAEIEHGLLIEYLYAAYSAKHPVGASIATIAKQEMGHLITVQNLLLLLGAEPYMGRHDLSAQPAKDPFPFVLEPLSLVSLAKYAMCEAPEDPNVHPDLRPAVEEARGLVATAAPFVNRVGALYAKLYWLFMDNDEDVGIWRDFPAHLFKAGDAGRHVAEITGRSIGRQARPEEWIGSVIDLLVFPCETRASARDAIFAIAAQGEGSPGTTNSHFGQFIESFVVAKTAAELAFDVPTQPTIAAEQPGTIDHPRALPLVALCDTFYDLVVLETLLALGIDPQTPAAAEQRSALLEASVEDMTSAVRRIAGRLMRSTPRRSTQQDSDSPRAAPTFALSVPARGDRSALVQAFRETIDRLQADIERLRATPNDAVVATWPGIFQVALDQRRSILKTLEQSS